MSRRECKTQEEADAAVAAGDVVVLRGSASAWLRGSASAWLHDSASAELHGSARAWLRDSASAVLYGSASAVLYGSASAEDGRSSRALHQHHPVLLIGPIGSRSAMLAARFPVDGGDPILETGCFYGSLAEFRAALAKTHPTGQHAIEYAAALTMIEAIAGRAP